jgi:hypothetical protein
VALRMRLRCMLGNSIKWNKGRAVCSTLHFRMGADGDLALFGKCPEVVRVDNCTALRPMSSVLETIPRVIHPLDIKTRVIHVAGREWHYVTMCVAYQLWRWHYMRLSAAIFLSVLEMC